MPQPETLDPKYAFIVGNYYAGRIGLCAYDAPSHGQAELALLVDAPRPHALHGGTLSRQGAHLERLPEHLRSMAKAEAAAKVAEQRGAQLVYCFWDLPGASR